MKIILTEDFRYLRDATESDTGFVEVDEIDYHLLKDNMKYYYKDGQAFPIIGKKFVDGEWVDKTPEEILAEQLPELKKSKKEQILKEFQQATSDSIMHSTTLNAEVDYGERHLRNVTSLVDYMEASNMQSTQFRIADNSFVEVSLDQLKALKLEMIGYGIYLYQRKWEIEQQIENATTLEELEVIKW